MVHKKENQDMRLQAIIDYEMNEEEIAAYELALVWVDLSRKFFPDYNHTGFKKGDPRKSLIFKYCFKLRRERAGLIAEKDFALYIRAQLDVLKYLSTKSKTPILVDPHCLVGDKAWVRWKLWKKKYESITHKPEQKTIGPALTKIFACLENTKEFLVKNLGNNPNYEKFCEMYTNKNIFRWVKLGKISPYYLVCSPFISKLFTEDDYKSLNLDMKIYKDCITSEVQDKFKEMFPNELT
jgi:hypothetical protein